MGPDCENILYIECILCAVHIQGSLCAKLTGHEVLEHFDCSDANCCAAALHKEACHRYCILEEGKPGTLTQTIRSAASAENPPPGFQPRRPVFQTADPSRPRDPIRQLAAGSASAARAGPQRLPWGRGLRRRDSDSPWIISASLAGEARIAAARNRAARLGSP